MMAVRKTTQQMAKVRQARFAYTLVELLVVIGIIAALLGMTAFFMPGFEAKERSRTGAARLQQGFLVARQRALLDGTTTGLRLFRDTGNANFITKAQYIQQPDDFTGGAVQTYKDPNSGQYVNNKILLTGVNVTGGFSVQALWLVQPGDYLQVNGAGLMHVIASITPSGNSAILTLASPLPYPVTFPTPNNYRIIRRPRQLGTENLLMPSAVGIDLTTNVKYGSPLPFNADGTLDILFSPSGSVLGNAAANRMIFWVREMSDPNDPFFGNPSLIVVFTRSGLVASYDVNTRNKTAPYSKIR